MGARRSENPSANALYQRARRAAIKLRTTRGPHRLALVGRAADRVFIDALRDALGLEPMP